MRRIVLDSNVLISAIAFGGKPRQVLHRIIEGKAELAFSGAILDEVRGVLGGRKLRYPEPILDAIMREIEALGVAVFPKKRVRVIRDDPDDNRVLECALEFRADCIISGDAHLLALKEFRGIRILKPAEFLEA